MPTTQVRVVPATSGSANERLEDFLQALNNVLGLSGNEWNDTTEDVANRWNQGVAFDNKLAGHSGKSLKELLFIIDELPDATITVGDPGVATANRLIQFGGFDCTFGTIKNFSVTGTTSSTFEFQSPINKFQDPTSGVGGSVRLMDGDNSHYTQIRCHQTNTANWTWTLPPAGPSANGQFISYNTDGSSSFQTLSLAGSYRGSLTLTGGSPNLPDLNSGTVNVGVALSVGDYWRIAANGTLDDGVDTKAVTEGQLLFVDNVTADDVDHFSVVGGAGASDTNIFTTATLTNNFGNVSHDGNTHDFGIVNIGTLDFQAVAFGSAVSVGSAFAIDSTRALFWGGYTGAVQDGIPNRALGVEADGRVITFDVAPTNVTLRRIKLIDDLAAGTAFSILTGVASSVVLSGNIGTPTLANHSTQEAMAADVYLKFKVNGIEAEKHPDLDAAIGVTRVSDTHISFTQDLPGDSIITIELLS